MAIFNATGSVTCTSVSQTLVIPNYMYSFAFEEGVRNEFFQTTERSQLSKNLEVHTLRKYLHTKVTPDFHLTSCIVKMGEILGRNQNDKNGNFQYISIKSYVLDVY